MKTIIAGSRDIKEYGVVLKAIQESGFDITEVVSGVAKGVDQLGMGWGYRNNLPVKLFPADWDMHGKAAGPIRNIEMAKYAEALIAVWDGKSRGTKHMIDEANKRGLKVFVMEVHG